MSHRIIIYQDLKPKKGIDLSKTQLWRLERAGKFPKRVQLSPGRHGWVEAEIDALIAERIAARDEKTA